MQVHPHPKCKYKTYHSDVEMKCAPLAKAQFPKGFEVQILQFTKNQRSSNLIIENEFLKTYDIMNVI